MKVCSLIILWSLFCSSLFGQVDIFLDKNGNSVKINPPDGYQLEGIEWGDGTFSDTEKEKNLSKKKLQEITIYLTCNSAEGTNNLLPDQPKSKTSIIVPTSLSAENLKADTGESCCDEALPKDENIVIQNIFKAMPQEDMGVLLSYRNTETYPVDGVLVLCYNEIKEKKSNTPFIANKHFDFVEEHEHFGESPLNINNLLSSANQPSSSTLLAATTPTFDYWQDSGSEDFRDLQSVIKKEQTRYQNFNAWRFNQLNATEARNFYVILKGREEMGKDPGRKITIKGYYIPDGGEPIPFEKTLVINTSHDPNRTTLSPNKLNYRFLDKLKNEKTLDLLVEFQNNGTAAAKDVYVKLPIPKGLDAHSLKVMDYSFKKECLFCTPLRNDNCLDTIISQDTITFHFKGISLPGSKTTMLKKNGKVVEKKGENIKKRDTQGFIEFSLSTKHREKKKKGGKKRKLKVMEKKDFITQAHIIFDNNEPIITNQAKSKFKTGLSPGFKLAYRLNGNGATEKDNFFVGLTLSPYRAKFYPQLELLYSLNDFTTLSYFRAPTIQDPATGVNQFALYERKRTGRFFQIPLLAKLDNKFISFGLGAQLELAFFENLEAVQIEQFPQNVKPTSVNSLSELNNSVGKTTKLRSSLIGEVGIGKVQKGPSIGIRGIFPTKDIKNYHWQIFAVWKI